MKTSASARRRDRVPLGPRIFGGGALLVGVLAFLLALSDLDEVRNAEFSPVNAAFMPVVVTGLWVLLAGIFFVKQLINPTADYPVIPEPEPKTRATEPEPSGRAKPDDDTDAESGDPDDGETDPDDGETDADRADADPADVRWRAPALLVAALIGYAFAIEPLGFVVTTPIFFVAVTLIFGSRKYVRDVIVAIALTAGMYTLFTRLLELSLPQGVWPW